MASIQQGLKEDWFDVSMVKLCRWFGIARRSVYNMPRKAAPKVKPELVEPIKAMIEAESAFGYRTVAGRLGMNKDKVQRIFQIKGWQVRSWATDLCRVWGGRLTEPGPGDRLPYPAIAGLAALAHRQGKHRRRGLGAGADHPLRHPGKGQEAAPAALGQWAGLHQPRLHPPSSRLRPEVGVHHSTSCSGTGWSSVSSERSRNSASIGTGSTACPMHYASSATGLGSTTGSGLTRH